MPVVMTVAKVVTVSEMMAMAAEVPVATEMPMTAEMPVTPMKAAMTVLHLDHAVFRCCSAELGGRQRLRGWLRRGQHDQTSQGDKA